MVTFQLHTIKQDGAMAWWFEFWIPNPQLLPCSKVNSAVHLFKVDPCVPETPGDLVNKVKCLFVETL